MTNCQLAINSLSWTTTEQKLKSLFSSIGKVEDVTLIKNLSGESLGRAFILMSNTSDAQIAARAFNRKVVDGKRITVSIKPQNDKSYKQAILAYA